MDGRRVVVTGERFAQGMTFHDYVTSVGTPENLEREAGWWLGPQRHDFSGLLRERYDHVGRTEAQAGAIRWLAAQPNGPTRMLVISEEWSSDCRRDVPMLARLAEAGGLELRIFPRDGRRLGRGPRADPAESPNADLVNELPCSSHPSSRCGRRPRWTRSSPRFMSSSWSARPLAEREQTTS